MLTIKQEIDFNDLKDMVWSGAVDTIQRVEDEQKEEELMNLLNEIFFEQQPDMTEVNDYLWIDSDYIYECLDISFDEEDDSEDIPLF